MQLLELLRGNMCSLHSFSSPHKVPSSYVHIATMEQIMAQGYSTDVSICGAGAAGLTLAIDLARRGVALDAAGLRSRSRSHICSSWAAHSHIGHARGCDG